MKKIWIVNYYAGTPQTAANPRYLHFAKRFMDAGYEVTTFNASNRVGLTAEDFKGQPFLKKQYGIYKFVHVAVPEPAVKLTVTFPSALAELATTV